MSDVFISYARSTEPHARQIGEALQKLGYSVWRDDELPAHRSYTSVIEERLVAAKAVVVVWSAEAVRSEWVQSEADRARVDHKLVQLSIDGSTPPMPFDRIQCADLNGWRGGADTAGWRKVVSAVGDLVERAPVKPEPAASSAPDTKLRLPQLGHLFRSSIAWIVAAASVVLIVGGLVAARLLAPPTPALSVPVVEVRPMDVIGADPALKPFAGRVSDAIAGFLGDSDVRIEASPGAGAKSSAPLAFAGAVSSADGQLRVRLTLVDQRSGTSLWSHDYAEPSARADALVDETKGGAMEIINLLRPSYGPSGLTTDAESILLGTKGGEFAAVDVQFNEANHQYELALARAPNSGILHAAHANGLALAGMFATPQEQPGLFQRAKAEAELTIRDYHAQSGLAYLALLQIARAQAPLDLVAAYNRQNAALAAAPETDFLFGEACGYDTYLGRAFDARSYCQRALALRPHTAVFLLGNAEALDVDGDDPVTSERMLDEGARLYPNFTPIRAYRFMREAFGGSPDKALALLHDPNTAPPLTPDEGQAFEALLKARKSGARADADAALALITKAEEHFGSSIVRILFPMALGRMDDAFSHPGDLALYQADNVLTAGYTAALRRDPRFWDMAARSGHVRYWLTSGRWPDFCSDPSYPLNCRAEAQKRAGVKPG